MPTISCIYEHAKYPGYPWISPNTLDATIVRSNFSPNSFSARCALIASGQRIPTGYIALTPSLRDGQNHLFHIHRSRKSLGFRMALSLIGLELRTSFALRTPNASWLSTALRKGSQQFCIRVPSILQWFRKVLKLRGPYCQPFRIAF